MNSIGIWLLIEDICEIFSHHIFTEKEAANIRKYAEIRLTGIKYKELRKGRRPKKMRRAK